MGPTRLSTRLLLPAGLILLVLLLGALQYQWLGQVSEAERAQLGRSLNQRAQEFAAVFDREMGLASSMLSIDAEALDHDPWAALAARFDAWQSRAMVPEMVRALYIARSSETGHSLTRWTPAGRAVEPIEWPDHFATVSTVLRLTSPRSAGSAVIDAPGAMMSRSAHMFTMSLPRVIDSVPALIMPIASRPVRLTDAPNVIVAMRSAGTDYLVVELDRSVIAGRFIPALADRFFPPTDSNHYRVAVLDREGERLFSRGFADDEPAELQHVDAQATFFGGLRSEFTARMVTESQLLTWQVEPDRRSTVVAAGALARGTPTPDSPNVMRQAFPMPQGNVSVFLQETTTGTLGAPTTQALRIATPGWTVQLQHGAGSLDDAVGQARVRNLATGFGILAVLAAGVGLIVANARKSETLAAQQMEFVATVSHELRTPLAVMRSAAQNLSAGVVEDPSQAKRYGELIEAEGRRLTDMVEEVLEFAGLSGNRRALALRPVDLDGLAHEVVDAHQQALRTAGIVARVVVDDDLPVFQADEDALRRGLNNLIGNAIKYAADGHRLDLTVRRDPTAATAGVVITVADQGPGIAPEDLPHLVEPFYRGRGAVERQIHGNGLGLSLVARIAEAHGGSLDVSSVPGEGATFALRLPANAASDVA